LTPERQSCEENIQVDVIDYLPRIGDDQLREEIITGLNRGSKYISSKFFYDSAGSRLFEDITSLPEYYLTRTECSILRRVSSRICEDLEDSDIIELGSGDCSKISILLNAIPSECFESVRYLPVDFSRSAVEESVNILLDSFAGLKIQGVVADFTRQLGCIRLGDRRLFCFFGSTIGNFKPAEGRDFMENLARIMEPGDSLLIGFDMVKEREIIERAYNDSAGVTAAFNRNILKVAGSLLESDIDPDDFEHSAFFNHEESRVEMHLKARRDVNISSPYMDGALSIPRGETIHTENSYKFTERSIKDLVSSAGLIIHERFFDEKRWFSLMMIGKERPY